MLNIGKIFNAIKKINYKTIYFNFHYFPFKQALKLPVLVAPQVYLKKLKGEIFVESPICYGLIRIGYEDVGIFDEKKSRTIWQVEGKVIFKGRANIGHGTRLSIYKNAKLTIGDNFHLTAESSIVVVKEVGFGKNCLLSWDILIMDGDLHPIRNKNGEIINPPQKIMIGNDVWIGCRCLILKGSSIPDNSIIGANTFIHGKLENRNGCIWGESPVKVLKEDITWDI